jgi:hypothetical protein
MIVRYYRALGAFDKKEELEPLVSFLKANLKKPGKNEASHYFSVIKN